MESSKHKDVDLRPAHDYYFCSFCERKNFLSSFSLIHKDISSF